jgi:thioredoxin 1
MSNVIELSEADFDNKTKEGVWVIDFWAPWCGPCKMMSPNFEKASLEMDGKANFAKINVDGNIDISAKFEVMSIPTMLILKDGAEISRRVGLLTEQQIRDEVGAIL